MQILEERHGLEILILTILRPEIGYNIYRKLEKHKLNSKYNLEFETSEFLTLLKSVYQQAPTESSRKSIRGYYNSCFDNPQGMNPFVHEMFTAQFFHGQGLVVEFVDLSQEESTFDFRCWKNDLHYLSVDCKSIGRDIGRAFTASQSQSLYDEVIKIVARKPQKFDKTILRFNAKKRVNLLPKVRSHLIEQLLKGVDSYSLSDIHLSMDRANFSDKAHHDIIAIKKENHLNTFAQVGDILCSQFGEPNKSGWEWCYWVSSFTKDFRFAMLFTSDTRFDWVNSAIQVIKSSLNGQLKNEGSCFFSLRLNEISDEEYGAVNACSDFETGRINPSDFLVYELFKERFYDRICGISFFCRPRYKKTSVFNTSGAIITRGNHATYTVLNPNHPISSGFEQILGCSRKNHR